MYWPRWVSISQTASLLGSSRVVFPLSFMTWSNGLLFFGPALHAQRWKKIVRASYANHKIMALEEGKLTAFASATTAPWIDPRALAVGGSFQAISGGGDLMMPDSSGLSSNSGSLVVPHSSSLSSSSSGSLVVPGGRSLSSNAGSMVVPDSSSLSSSSGSKVVPGNSVKGIMRGLIGL